MPLCLSEKQQSWSWAAAHPWPLCPTLGAGSQCSSSAVLWLWESLLCLLLPPTYSHGPPVWYKLTLLFSFTNVILNIYSFTYTYLEFSFFCVYRKHHKEMEKISLFEIITYSVVINATDSQKSGAKYMQFGRLFSSWCRIVFSYIVKLYLKSFLTACMSNKVAV